MSDKATDQADKREPENGDAASSSAQDAPLRRIGEALRGLRFGSVLAIVQDGVVIQIERTEKTRLTR